MDGQCSELKSNILYKAKEYGVDVGGNDPKVKKILDILKSSEQLGYQYEGAEASLLLMMHEARGSRERYFELGETKVTTAMEPLKSDEMTAGSSTAKAEVVVAGKTYDAEAEGNGPVHAIATALRGPLGKQYPELANVKLTDYKVRILNKGMGFASTVRVLIRATDGREVWGTVGVSTSVVEASRQAIVDTFEYKLMKAGAKVQHVKATG